MRFSIATRLAAIQRPLAIREGVVKSEASEPQSLDGIEVDYTYSGGGRVILSFYDGYLRYRWLSGPFEGVEESDLKFQSKKIGAEKHMVSWHDTKNFNFATLIFDFDEKVVHSSALIYYGTENEVSSFDQAVMNSIRRVE
jgi:hypothetical protein